MFWRRVRTIRSLKGGNFLFPHAEVMIGLGGDRSAKRGRERECDESKQRGAVHGRSKTEFPIYATLSATANSRSSPRLRLTLRIQQLVQFLFIKTGNFPSY